jgi:MSHA pilin protein MshA
VTETGVQTEFGYPEASLAGVLSALDVDAQTNKTGEWIYAIVGDTVIIAPSGRVAVAAGAGAGNAIPAEITGSGCYITYTEAPDADNQATVVISDATGC